MPSDVCGLRTQAAAAATPSRSRAWTGQFSCVPRTTPAAKASPAPVVLRTASRGIRTEPCRHVRPPGAGDAFAAGVVLGTHENWPVHARLRLGVAAAAACVRSPQTSEGIGPAEACLGDADRAGYRATTG